ncbi:unnamed protein product, partial [Amoebophrya sp. A25]
RGPGHAGTKSPASEIKLPQRGDNSLRVWDIEGASPRRRPQTASVGVRKTSDEDGDFSFLSPRIRNVVLGEGNNDEVDCNNLHGGRGVGAARQSGTRYHARPVCAVAELLCPRPLGDNAAWESSTPARRAVRQDHNDNKLDLRFDVRDIARPRIRSRWRTRTTVTDPLMPEYEVPGHTTPGVVTISPRGGPRSRGGSAVGVDEGQEYHGSRRGPKG